MTRGYQTIYSALYRYYGPQYWWPADTSLEMMISAILVQNTNWHNAAMALNSLRPYLTPDSLEKLQTDELAHLIRPSGFYNVKAKRIQAFLNWIRHYDYEINWLKQQDSRKLRCELLKINGIGRETADDILLYALHRPLFIVDAYARRIFYRLGFDMPSGYDTFQKEIERSLPEDVQLFNEFHALLVEHAKVHCQKTPVCNGCPLADRCEKRLD